MIGDEEPATLVAAAVRTRAVGLRDELARAGLGGAGTLAELLAAARAARRGWLRARGRAVRPDLLAVLAQIIALQEVRPADRADALALYELIRADLGARAVPAASRAVYAQLAMNPQPGVHPQVRHEIRTDLANPFLDPRRPVGPWLRRFGAGLPEPAIRLDGRDSVPPFDRLCTAEPTPVVRPERISVVVTAYRPGEGLLTAVRSIVRQSWRNLEVLVVDDGSAAEHEAILRAAVALDPRVRLLRQARNAGTYVARNAGLDAATGAFVTFQDSDDWSHPRRLELQVAPLLDEPELVASTSDGRRVTEHLTLTRLGRRGGKLNPSSLLIRRDVVPARVGYFDVVRKGGDSEYIDRIVAACGPRAVRHLPVHLALIRLSAGSLSRAEVRPYWIHPARAVYRSGYATWHSRIAAGAAPAFRPRDGANRPFPAPAHLSRPAGARIAAAAYDVVVAADWRAVTATQRSALAEIEALLARGLRVAILHLEDWRRPARARLPVHPAVQEQVNAGRIGQITRTDPARCGLLLVREPELLRFPPAGPVGLVPRTVLVLVERAPDRATAPCAAAAERMFGVPAWWCPQRPEVRAALLREDLPVTGFDLPTVAAVRRGGPGPAGARPVPCRPVIGAEVHDRADLAVLDRLTGADIRIRVDDGVRLPRQPAGRLVYQAADLEPLEFYGQLDFSLHFAPSPAQRPVLDAATMGCIPLTAEPGPVGVHCAAADVAEVVRRYRTDPVLAAEQRRLDRLTLRKEHAPRLFAERVHELAVGERNAR
ncbi:glycosyltransferase family A protein [Actinoplanes teichomyceticus]|uniref:Glycosyl transferase family 2 n=1 Tax=Actinoplanes teichomyceticus TaxID=1867 RepID=A0A561WNI3_ACTTI|nr:glycosyltransferase family A protein [Actinoplanes teichomyceticus]TWG25408.1 glycosyl transferase family 2 [Actinoplanes teichomyceticus]GIF10475.1 hypothetical protein Ate01nite_05070 [Actinoplanes teichomyceticus]